MSEEKKEATTETVSESPATETTQEALIEKLKAEQAYSKTQRQKKQDAQNRYERIRKPRVKRITRLSKQQALHNHISNPLLRKTRNFLMSKTPIIDKQMDRIYKFEL